MDWIIFLHAFTIINKCLLFLLLWFKRNSSLSNKLLALLILLPVVPIFTDFLMYTGKLRSFPYMIFVYQIIFNLFGPVFFYYCSIMTGKTFTYRNSKLLHLLVCLVPLYFLIEFVLLDQTAQDSFAANYLVPNHISFRMVVASTMPAMVVLAYVLASWKMVADHNKRLKDVFTNLESLKSDYIIQFIKVVVIEIAVLCIVYCFIPPGDVDLIWVPILGNILYFYIIYKSYNESLIFSEKEYEQYQKMYSPLIEYERQIEVKKYAGSVLSAEKATEYALVLTNGFGNKHWYLDSELNLKTLSVISTIPIQHLSQTINQQFGKNFFDFVNTYRVEALKAKLKDNSFADYKIEAIAYTCGFNSKTAFQRAFKKNARLSPSEFRNISDYKAV
jgi:AraC-like DNA-binding protein